MIDISKWENIAAQRVHERIAAPGRLSGKIAIVTGSAQGFGKGIAEGLYNEGACVVIADINEQLAKTVSDVMGERAFCTCVDVTNEENAICPGNFLEGPLWQDPERGLFVQYLRSGKVPGAQTIEDVKRYYESKVPMNRGCLPSDVTKAILYAVEQSYETGQAIPVTGGQIMLS